MMPLNLKTIVWIDKEEVVVEEYIDCCNLRKIAKIFIFTNYNEALDFVADQNHTIDLVIANYCTFYWISALEGKIDSSTEPVAYDFYNVIKTKLPKTPFLLFSAIADLDNRTKQFCSLKDFFYLPKDQGDKLYQKVYNIFEDSELKAS